MSDPDDIYLESEPCSECGEPCGSDLCADCADRMADDEAYFAEVDAIAEGLDARRSEAFRLAEAEASG